MGGGEFANFAADAGAESTVGKSEQKDFNFTHFSSRFFENIFEFFGCS